MLDLAVSYECEIRSIPAIYIEKQGDREISRRGHFKIKVCQRTKNVTIEARLNETIKKHS